MSRLAPQLTLIALAGALGALLIGAPVLVPAFLVPSIGFSLWAWQARRSDQSERPWSTPPSAAPSVIDRPDRPSTVQVGRALGRVEAREIALSPWSAIGVGFCVLMVVSFAPSYDGHETWGDIVQDLPFLAHPLVGMMVLVGHRLGTRAGRDGAAELFAGCPTTARTRSLGLLAAIWVPVAALALFVAAYLAVVEVFVPDVRGTLGAAQALTVLAGMVLGAGGLALGVALARWVRNPLAPVVAVVLIGLASPRLGSGAPGEVSTRMLLSTLPGISDQAPLLTAGQAALHLIWLVAITVATGAVALIGHRQDVAVPVLPARAAPAGLAAGASS